MKIRPAKQDEVLLLMRVGWALGHSGGINGRPWLQKNGLGKGGESRDVHASAFSSLYKRKLIRIEKAGFPWTSYSLTDAGRGDAAGQTKP